MLAQVTVRARDGMRQWDLNGWTSWVMLAALSAEPETLGELNEATRRYLPTAQLFERARQVDSLDAVPGEHEWLLIDLTSRSVLAGNDFELPQHSGAYRVDGDDLEPDGYEEQALHNGSPIIWV